MSKPKQHNPETCQLLYCDYCDDGQEPLVLGNNKPVADTNVGNPPPYDEDLDLALNKIVVKVTDGKPVLNRISILGIDQAKAALTAVVLRAQIAELETIRKNFGSLTLHEFGKGSTYSLDERLATLHQQLKEVEGK